MSERERRRDAIRETSDRLTELARRYDRLRWMAELERLRRQVMYERH